MLGLFLGIGLGAISVPAETLTQVESTTLRETSVVTTTKVVVKRKIVRKPPVTITTAETIAVPKGGDNAVDYGNFAGLFTIRGVQGYGQTYGGSKIVGQIQAPSGCDGYVQIDATFYKDGQIVDTDFTNFESLPAQSWVPFEITQIEGEMDSYDLLLTKADCG